MDRIILHCDCNSFFASAETLLAPELSQVPMAVAGDPENRHGIILAKNELAKKFNIQTAEPIWRAKQKCPNLVCVLPHHSFYEEISEKINMIYLEYTDLVEPASIDESYLDITNSIALTGMKPKEFADFLRDRIKNDIGITISIGVSFCKTFAKLGSDYKKPDATTVISRESVEKIVYPLNVENMLMSGKKTTDALNRFGIKTIGDLAESDCGRLERMLGRSGVQLWRAANGLEKEPVRSYYEPREVKSVGNSMTFRKDLTEIEDIKGGIALLSDSVASRLRHEHKKATVIQLGIKDEDFCKMQRQKTLTSPTYLQKDITAACNELLINNWNFAKKIRLLSVTASGLTEENESFSQLDMFSRLDDEKQEKIEDAMSEIRKKYGSSSIKFGHFKDDETGIT